MRYNRGINILGKFKLFSAPWRHDVLRRGQLTSAAPCVTADKQQEGVQSGGAAAGGSEEPEPSHHAS